MFSFLFMSCLALPLSGPFLDMQGSVQLSGSSVTSVAFSPDGAWIAAGLADGVLHVFAAEGEPEGTEIPLDGGVLVQVTFSAGGEKIVVGSNSGSVHLLEREGSDWTLLGSWGHTHYTLTAVALDEESGRLAVGDSGGRLYAVQKGELSRIGRLTMKQDVVYLEFLPGGRLMAIGKKGRYLQVDIEKEKVRGERKLKTNPINRTPDILDVSRVGDDLVLSTMMRSTSQTGVGAVAGGGGFVLGGALGATIKVTAYLTAVDPATGESGEAVKAGSGVHEAFEILPGAEYAVSVFSPHRGAAHTYASPQLSLWNAATGEELRTLEVETPAFCIAADPTGGYVAVGGVDGTVDLWKVSAP